MGMPLQARLVVQCVLLKVFSIPLTSGLEITISMLDTENKLPLALGLERRVLPGPIFCFQSQRIEEILTRNFPWLFGSRRTGLWLEEIVVGTWRTQDQHRPPEMGSFHA